MLEQKVALPHRRRRGCLCVEGCRCGSTLEVVPAAPLPSARPSLRCSQGCWDRAAEVRAVRAPQGRVETLIGPCSRHRHDTGGAATEERPSSSGRRSPVGGGARERCGPVLAARSGGAAAREDISAWQLLRRVAPARRRAPSTGRSAVAGTSRGGGASGSRPGSLTGSMRLVHVVTRSHRRSAELGAMELAAELDGRGHRDRVVALSAAFDGSHEPGLEPLADGWDRARGLSPACAGCGGSWPGSPRCRDRPRGHGGAARRPCAAAGGPSSSGSGSSGSRRRCGPPFDAPGGGRSPVAWTSRSP